jgi:hypothetical protein
LLISQEPTADTKHTGNHIGRHGHELRRLILVPERLHDRRHEQRDRVQRRVDADRDEHVHPDLPVPNRVPEEAHVELVGQRAAVFLEPPRDLVLFGLREEFGCVRVVVHDEEGGDG